MNGSPPCVTSTHPLELNVELSAPVSERKPALADCHERDAVRRVLQDLPRVSVDDPDIVVRVGVDGVGEDELSVLPVADVAAVRVEDDDAARASVEAVKRGLSNPPPPPP